jgi:NADH-quinone oxidoreductase subunit F
LVYKLIDENNNELVVSQTFANISKVSNGNEVFVISKNEKIKRIIKIDENLNGTIAILKMKNDEDIFSGYKYKQVKIEKVEA